MGQKILVLVKVPRDIGKNHFKMETFEQMIITVCPEVIV